MSPDPSQPHHPPRISRRWFFTLGSVAIVLVVFWGAFQWLLPEKTARAGNDRKRAAPDLAGGVGWLNTAGPLRLKDLRGKIVLLDFWTYCCINCIHTLPDLAKLEKKYANQLVVVGVHSAKFDNEKESDHIRKAILRYEINHPVVNDSAMKIWRKYEVESWPTLV